MIINRAILKINESEYDILRLKYGFRRKTDSKGRPITGGRGGDIFVLIESGENNYILQQMLKQKAPPIKGSIEVLMGTDGQRFRYIEFEQAYIYSHEECTQFNSWQPMFTTIAISPVRLDIDNKIHLDRRWPETSGFFWHQYKPQEVKYAKVDPQTPPTPLITAVKGESTALPNAEVEYSVTNYNINVQQSDKDRVKWVVEIDGNQELQKRQGEELKLTIKEEWVNKEITVMPYLKKPTTKVSTKTKITDCKHVDGAVSIASYIVNEIKTNTKSDIAGSIRYFASYEEYKKRYEEWRQRNLLGQLLSPPEPQNLLKAKALWTERVFKGRPWDHKDPIRLKFNYLAVEKTNPKTNITYKSYHHKYKNHDYFYDVWSNIHYGYVGLSVGFDEQMLLSGADLAQIIDSRGKNTEDAGDDKISMKIGFALYYKYGRYAEGLTAQDILDALDVAPMTESKSIHVCLQRQK